MLEGLMLQLNIKLEELVNQGVLTGQAIEEINNFYQRIEKLLNDTSFKEKRNYYAHDLVITHSKRVAIHSVTIARLMKLPPRDCSEIGVAAAMHDLDKLYWPAHLLDKPKNELSRTDWTRIMEHAVASAIFVERLTRYQISSNVLLIIKQHHENLDGTGYPGHLTGNNICLGARIVRVTDSYDSMVSMRPYKKEVCSPEFALNELKQIAGSIYDPQIVKWFEESLAIPHKTIPNG